MVGICNIFFVFSSRKGKLFFAGNPEGHPTDLSGNQ